MGRRIEIEIDGVTYSGATASAKDQLEMIQISASSSILPALSDGVSDMALVSCLAATDSNSLARLIVLCIKNGKIVRDSDEAPVAENLFQDTIHSYLMLLGRVLRENVGNFWQLNAKTESASAESETPVA
ncbi:phage tail assembly chaperone [Dickeya undicola]|uniref:Phage tail protein n=1 Tax=Dickeya undicola TaxID=1577887 RepID=A0A3N0G603_9GAMM|nr:hypothetical protein [Dickeya undicola]RNM07701.1 hypothetical protein EF878_07120 [Dickeya undicola]